MSNGKIKLINLYMKGGAEYGLWNMWYQKDKEDLKRWD